MPIACLPSELDEFERCLQKRFRLTAMDEQHIFELAKAINDAAERAAWLDSVLGEGPERQRIESMLRDASDARDNPTSLDATVAEHHGDDSQMSNDHSFESPPDFVTVSSNENTEVWEKSEDSSVRSRNDRYVLYKEIARGGVGAIHLCRDLNLGRNLAAKVLLDSHIDHPGLAERFVEEAQIASQLQHPGIAPVHELGTLTDDRPYFTMKLIRGKTLRSLLARREPESEKETLRFVTIFKQICQTVAYAHSRKVIHRDLKPGNIMIGKFGEVQVMDWGLAKVLSEEGDPEEPATVANNETTIRTVRTSDSSTHTRTADSKTQFGSVMGTPAYMPPEQARGEIELVDERADVFGLGAILCEILTGLPPYTKDESFDLFEQAAMSRLNPCRKRLQESQADEQLVQLTLDCLEPDLGKRLRAADQMVDRLTDYEESLAMRLRVAEMENVAAEARAEEALQTAIAEKRARRWQLGVAVLCVAATLLGVFVTKYFLDVQTEYSQRIADSLESKSDTLYVAHMQMASQAWKAGSIARVRELLDRHIPVQGQPDRRSDEWFFLDHLCQEIESMPAVDFGEIVVQAAVDPNADFFLVSDNFGAFHIYDFQTLELRQQIQGHDSKITQLQVTPSGNCIISSDQEKLVVWKRSADQFEPWLTIDDAWPYSAKLTADATRLFVPVGDTQIAKIDLVEGDVDTGLVLPEPISQFCLMPDNHLLVAYKSGGVEEWESINSTKSRTIFPKEQVCQQMELAPGGSRLVAKLGKRVVIANLTPSTPQISEINADTSDSRAIIAFRKSFLLKGNNSIRVWNYDGEFVKQIAFGDNFNVVRTTNPDYVAFTGFDNFVHLYSTDSWDSAGRLKGHINTTYAVDVTPDGQVISGGRDTTVRVRTLESASSVARTLVGHKSWIWRVCYSPDSSILASVSRDGWAILWDTETGQELSRFEHASDIHSATFSPDGRRLVTGSADGIIRWWDLVSQNCVEEYQSHDGTVNVLQFSEDGEYLLSCAQDARAILWQVETGEPVHELQADASIWAGAFRSEQEIYLGTTRDEVLRWRPSEDDATALSFAAGGDVTFLSLSNSGETLAVAAANGVITLIDTISGDIRVQQTAHTSDAMCVAFSPDDRTLASVGSDGSLVFWSMKLLEPTLRSVAHDAHVHSIEFAPNGSQFATGSWDASVKLWRLR